MPELTATAQSEPSIFLPRWMRLALWFTTGLNLLGAVVFLPGFPLGRSLIDLPDAGHPLYFWTIAEFIGIMGIGYGYCAWINRASPVFIGAGAAGKLAFFATVTAYWLAGSLPIIAPLLVSSDLVLGCLFLVWLVQSKRATP